ncbi:MAG: U32 family peptidase [Bacillota bacterium]|nr:U32 family peptidase [Bacillota bacterium]
MVTMITNNRLKPELLAPAGDFEKFRFALAYGADAVYLGGEKFGLRAKSVNFSLGEIAEAVKLASEKGAKVYVTVNIFAHEEDIEELPQYLQSLNDIGPQGLLVSDLGVLALAKKYAPNIPLHISTQANSLNSAAISQWQTLGAERVVLGREISLKEIAAIAPKVDCELEMFIHGAMCMSYSGRCLLSNYLTGRDANGGACTHPCRWQYALVEAKRPGEYFPIEEDSRGSYIMNSKDLNLLSYLPDLMDIGIDSFKIEGRVKSCYYVAVVTKVYREAIDTIWSEPERFAERLPYWQKELKTVSHRQYTAGFLESKPQAGDHGYESSGYVRDYDFVAIVKGYDDSRKALILEQRNNFKVGDKVEFLSPRPGIPPVAMELISLYNEDMEEVSVAPHPQMQLYLPYEHRLPPYTMIRRRR